MIYYFSGTGNTRYVAMCLANLLDERVVSIFDREASDASMTDDQIGFVVPVYSWGVSPVVEGFIKSLGKEFWRNVRKDRVRVWCVMTCGDEVALAPEMLESWLTRYDVSLESVWSVIMPNNYVLLPGFDVDPDDVEARKLVEAPLRIKEIAAGISGKKRGIYVTRGSMPRLKTRLVYPVFKKWGIIRSLWHSTDACVGCGRCASVCPCGNIGMKEGRPVWGEDCTSCLRCYHSCPERAVAYGSFTRGKGQYLFPERDIPVLK